MDNALIAFVEPILGSVRDCEVEGRVIVQV